MPPTSGAGDAALDDEGRFVRALLVPPRLSGDVVSRPRLLARMDEATRSTFCLISGEPASGKTSLVVSWLALLPADRPLAWFAVPHELEDNLAFWRYLLRAIAPLDVAVRDLDRALIDGDPPNHQWLTVLANRLGVITPEPLVVIDDLHEVDSAITHRALHDLIELLPENVHVVAMTRAKPPWSLASWQVTGRLSEIDSMELRFTRDELATVVDANAGVELTDEETDLLLDRSEGWAGGIKLAMLSMRHAADPHTVIERYGTGDELLSNYLFREVLESQDPDVRNFLLDVSVLRYVEPDIADSMRERDDSRELLEHCRSEHLFMVDVEGSAPMSRLHSLFAQLLRARLKLDDPDRFLELHRRASTILETRRDIRGAIEHAIEGGDDPRTGQLVSRYSMDLAHTGQFDEIRAWQSLLRRAPGNLPETSMALATTLALTGRADDALALLDELDLTRLSARGANGVAQVRAMVLMAGGRVDRLEDAANTVDRYSLDDGSPTPFDGERLALFMRGMGAYHAGDLARACDNFEKATALRRATDLFYVSTPGWLARMHLTAGRLTEAERLVGVATERQAELGSGETSVIVPAHLATAGIAWERDDFDTCDRYLSRARRAVRPIMWQMIAIECAAARLRCSQGDHEKALADLEEVGRIYLSRSSPDHLRAEIALVAIEVAIKAGDADEAERWAASYRGWSDRPLPLGTRIRLATEPVDELEILVDTAAEGTTSELIEARLAMAEALAGAGDHSRAAHLLADATAIAEPDRLVRRFCETAPRLQAMLRSPRSFAAQVSDHSRIASPFFLSTLSSAIGDGPNRSPITKRVSDELVDQLSEREIQVLGQLVDGVSYTDIGTELYISRNTVKSHVRHVYTKLGVSSRAAAAGEARRLQLI